MSNLFKYKPLNTLAEEIIELYSESSLLSREINKTGQRLFHKRWLAGKHVFESLDKIKEICGTQQKFTEQIGVSPEWLSRNISAYRALKELCKNQVFQNADDEFAEHTKILEQKAIFLTVRNFESLPRLLNEPEGWQSKHEDKDLKRLKELENEAQEIIARNEKGATPKIAEMGEESLRFITDSSNYLSSQDPIKAGYKSNKYLEFVRLFGKDIVTGQPIEVAEPHHVTENMGTGSMGETLSDLLAIPVSHQTHDKLHEKKIRLTNEQIYKAQRDTLAFFVSKVLGEK